MHENNYPSVKHSTLLFSLFVISFIYIAAYFQKKDFHSGILITQFIIVLLPPIFLSKVFGFDVKSVLRLNKTNLTHVLHGVGILVFSLPLVFIVNIAYVLFIKSTFGNIIPEKIPVAQNVNELLLFFFIIGVSAGICEEVLFRGFIMKGLERLGARKAIFISSFLFGSIHLSIEKLPATFLLGLIMGFVVYKTNSIYTGMIMHFLNNSFAVFLSYTIQKLSGNSEIFQKSYMVTPDIDTMVNSQLLKIFIFLMFLGIIFVISLFCLTVLYYIVRSLFDKTRDITFYTDNPKPFSIIDFLPALPGLVIIAIIYLKEGSILLGINNNTIDWLFRLVYIY